MDLLPSPRIRRIGFAAVLLARTSRLASMLDRRADLRATVMPTHWCVPVAVVGTLLVGCSSSLTMPEQDPRPARLVQPGAMNKVSNVIGRIPAPVLLMGALPICLDTAGAVTVTGVRPWRGDLVVRDFAVRANPLLTGGFMIGDALGTLAANGVEALPMPLTTVRDGPSGRVYELVVELEQAAVTTRADGFVVDCASAGERGSLEIPIAVTFCPAPAAEPAAGAPTSTC